MNWTDEYREIVEFYYWEPQHIGRANGERRFRNADEMYAHVGQLEVSLNHILNIFFSLYPSANIDCLKADASHEMMSAWQLELLQREQKNATQPDMFFQGKESNLAVELKIGSKCTKEQIEKYIRFNDALPNAAAKSFSITILSPYADMHQVFKEKYATPLELVADIGADVTLNMVSFDQFYAALPDRFEDVIERKLVTGLKSYLRARPELRIETV